MTVIGEAFVAVSPETAGFANKLEQQFKSIDFSSFASVAGGAAVAAAIGGLIKIGDEFENVRHQIEQQTGASGAALQGLASTVNTVFSKVPVSLNAAATAVDELYRRGVPLGSQLTELAEQETFLAKITGGDLAQQVEDTTAIFNKFGIAVGDQPKILDELFKATQFSGDSLAEITGPLLSAGAALQEFGFTASQSIGLIATLSKSGVDVTRSWTALRIAFSNITKQGLGDPVKVLEQLNTELKDNPKNAAVMTQALLILGNRGGLELARAMQQGKFNFADAMKVIADGKDGIIETGVATESLGDKFRLLGNNILLGLEPIGTKLLADFTTVFDSLEGPLLHLASALSQAFLAFAPLVGAATGFGVVGESLGPIIEAFATGLQGIASVVSDIPAPILALAGAVGVLALAFNNLILKIVANPSLIANFFADLNPVTAGLVAAGIAITALGFAMKALGSYERDVAEESKKVSQALFDTQSGSALFADGVTNATQGLADFLAEQIKAGNDKTLANTLTDTGTSLNQLVTLFNGPKAAFSNFLTEANAGQEKNAESANGWLDKLKEVGKLLSGQGDTKQSVQAAAGILQLSGKITDAVTKERDAYVNSAKTQILAVQASNSLSKAQVANIIQTSKNKDGTIDWSKALDHINVSLEKVSEQTNATAQAAANASPSYAALVTLFAQGAISADDLQTRLQEGFNFDTAGAKAAVTSLTTQIKSLTDTVTKAFPTLDQAVSGLGKKFATTYTDLVDRTTDFRNKYGAQLLAAARAGQTLSGSAASDFQAIQNDLHKLATNPDLGTFTTNLQRQATQIKIFFVDLARIAQEGNVALANNLLDLGVKDGSQLAIGFAADSNKAKSANAAAEIIQNTKNASLSQVEALAPDFLAIGKSMTDGQAKGMKLGEQPADVAKAQAPMTIAAWKAIAALAAANSKPDLKTPTGQAIAQAAGTAISDRSVPTAFQGLSAKAAAAFKPDMTPGAKDAAAKAANLIAGNQDLPKAAATQAKKTQNQFTPDIVAQVLKQFNAGTSTIRTLVSMTLAAGTAGHAVGIGFDSGLAEGIVDGGGDVYTAAYNTALKAGTAAAAALKVKSPSRVGMLIGQNFSAGIALGILAGGAQVDSASASIANQLSGVTSTIIAGFNDAGTVSTEVGTLTKLLAQLGDSANSAASALGGVGSTLSTLLSTIASAVPTAGTALSNFLSTENSDQDSVNSALKDYHKAYQDYHRDIAKQQADNKAMTALQGPMIAAQNQLNAAVAAKLPAPQIDAYRTAYNNAKSAFDSARSSAHSAANSIASDQQTIADAAKTLTTSQQALSSASDPKTFIANLNKQTAQSKKFNADITKLAKEGFTDLASELAQEGSASAGKLADAFAKSAKDSKLANAAIVASNKYASVFTTNINTLLGGTNATSTATAAGTTVGNAIGTGITKNMNITFTNGLQTVQDKLERNPMIVGTTADISGVATSLKALSTTTLPSVNVPVHAALTNIGPLPVTVQPQMQPLPKLAPITVDVIPNFLGGGVAAAALAPTVASSSGVQTFQLDLTIELPNGTVVTGTKTLEVPAPTAGITQKVTTQIQAS